MVSGPWRYMKISVKMKNMDFDKGAKEIPGDFLDKWGFCDSADDSYRCLSIPATPIVHIWWNKVMTKGQSKPHQISCPMGIAISTIFPAICAIPITSVWRFQASLGGILSSTGVAKTQQTLPKVRTYLGLEVSHLACSNMFAAHGTASTTATATTTATDLGPLCFEEWVFGCIWG